MFDSFCLSRSVWWCGRCSSRRWATEIYTPPPPSPRPPPPPPIHLQTAKFTKPTKMTQNHLRLFTFSYVSCLCRTADDGQAWRSEAPMHPDISISALRDEQIIGAGLQAVTPVDATLQTSQAGTPAPTTCMEGRTGPSPDALRTGGVALRHLERVDGGGEEPESP